MSVATGSAALPKLERIYDVPGFVSPLDVELFARLFEVQDGVGVRGDVLEIGVWFGRTAILLEYLKDERELLHVCDLFEDPPPTRAGQAELAAFTGPMATRTAFEASFRAFHDTLPVIHQCPSSDLSTAELGDDRFRFVHVDGSHTYEAVTRDIGLACELVTPGGVVAFDDFANGGYPSVAAAVWPAVMERDVEPFACSPSKLYATRGSDSATNYRKLIEDFAAAHGYGSRLNKIPGSSILSIWSPPQRRSFRVRVAGRLRRMARRTLVTAPILAPDYMFVPLA